MVWMGQFYGKWKANFKNNRTGLQSQFWKRFTFTLKQKKIKRKNTGKLLTVFEETIPKSRHLYGFIVFTSSPNSSDFNFSDNYYTHLVCSSIFPGQSLLKKDFTKVRISTLLELLRIAPWYTLHMSDSNLNLIQPRSPNRYVIFFFFF